MKEFMQNFDKNKDGRIEMSEVGVETSFSFKYFLFEEDFNYSRASVEYALLS